LRKSSTNQWVLRGLIYILGLFLMALGVAFSVNSNLGISPITSLPYIVSQVTGMSMKVWVIAIFGFYIVLQALILRKDFKPVNLLQILFVTIFGYFTDFAKKIVGDFTLPGYVGMLVMLVVGIMFIALGVFLYIEVELVPMPMEGLTLALSKKLKRPFPSVKIALDYITVAVSIIISLIGLRHLEGIREGTVITAVITGKMIAVIKNFFSPYLQRSCYSRTAEVSVDE